jgi:hypothetical protein
MTLTELADRVEQLTGPCRETDAAIKLAFAAQLFANGATKDEAVRILGGDLYADPLPYTASLDAAMTLVPEGTWYCLSGPHSQSGGIYKGGTPRFDIIMGVSEDRADGKAATASNATVAAALRFRARASMEEHHG